MANRIRQVSLLDHRLTPAESEIWIELELEHSDDSVDIRGRLLGPRCVYSSTVEIAYPLQPLSARCPSMRPLVRRFIIPEPSLWEPQTPFLYVGEVELWENGHCAERHSIIHGLRTIQLRRRLVLNGHSVSLRIIEPSATLERMGLLQLRAQGANGLLVPTARLDGQLSLADTFGFLVFGRVSSPEVDTSTHRRWANHPSFLGYLIDESSLELVQLIRDAGRAAAGPHEFRIGVEVGSANFPAPPGVDFFVGPPGAFRDTAMPSIPLLLREPKDSDKPAAVQQAEADFVLGSITRAS